MKQVSGASSAMSDATIHEQWVAAYRTPEAQGFYELAFDEIKRRLNPAPGATILDAGCGSCAKSVLLAARGFNVVSVDFSDEALSLAGKTIQHHRVEKQISLRQGDLMSLPFNDGEFSYILCWGVLMHVPDVERALTELARVLKPGGMLVTSEANMHSLQALSIRWLKRLFRQGRGRAVRTPAGIVNHEKTEHGELVTRETDVAWYTAECRRLGLARVARLPGQFTELYVVARWGPLRRMIHVWNHLWFRYVRRPGPAVANILIFRKQV